MLKVFTKPGCLACKTLLEKLGEEKREYVVIDTSTLDGMVEAAYCDVISVPTMLDDNEISD